jgi:hypothetical protein
MSDFFNAFKAKLSLNFLNDYFFKEKLILKDEQKSSPIFGN